MANEKNIGQLSPEELVSLRKKSIKILADHSMFGINQRAKLGMNKPFNYILFREPIDRIISHYNFFYYKLGYSGCKGIPIEKLPSKKLGFILQDLSELQVRYLTGIEKNTGNNITEKTYEQAIYNLENYYACFGVLDKLGESLAMLRKLLPNWLKLEDHFPLVNKNPINKRMKTDASVISKIKHYNQLDLDLYKHVIKKFDLKYKNLIESK